MKKFLSKNSSIILTILGSVGVVTTAFLAAKATTKANEIIEEMEQESQEEPIDKLEIVKKVAPIYIPTAISGTSTIFCIFGANVLNKRTQACIASAYALINESYKEYRDKIKKLYGKEADSKVREEIAKDKYNDCSYTCLSEYCDDIKHDDCCTFYDSVSKRYFEAPLLMVQEAEYLFNRLFVMNGEVSLNEFYNILGIEETSFGDSIGWNYTVMEFPWIDFEHEKTVLEDGLECFVWAPTILPTTDYIVY